MRKIIDHKRVEMTQDEWSMYQAICKSYNRANFKGEDLFSDHFETNSDGIIIFVKVPARKNFSLEVYCFLLSLMVNQHLRLVHEQTDSLVKEAKAELAKQYEQIKALQEQVSKKLVEDSAEK